MEKKLTILIVEDERPLASVIQKKLESLGFDTVSARTVEQGIQYLKDIPTISAIWLDHYLLGNQNGLDFVIQIKENPTWANIPIIVVSNTASEDKILHYLALGVDKYYVKSNHTLEEIVTKIKELVVSH